MPEFFVNQVIAWCRKVWGVALTPAASLYSLTTCSTRRVLNFPHRLVWNNQRFWGWAAMWVRRAVAKDLPKSTAAKPASKGPPGPDTKPAETKK